MLREGERALVQARLVDADGKGLPSDELLLRAVVFVAPAPAAGARSEHGFLYSKLECWCSAIRTFPRPFLDLS